jgi:RimJ/RimL family protein N-acetyltransferase
MLKDAFEDPEIFQFTAGPKVYSDENAREFIARQWNHAFNATAVSLAIVPLDAQLPAGLVGLFGSPFPAVAELSFWVIPCARRRGLAAAAATAIVDWAFPAFPRLQLIRLDCQPGNEATHQIAVRLGATHVGGHVRQINDAGVTLDRYELTLSQSPAGS